MTVFAYILSHKYSMMEWKECMKVISNYVMMCKVHSVFFAIFSSPAAPGETRPTLTRAAPQRPDAALPKISKNINVVAWMKRSQYQKSHISLENKSFWNQDFLELLHTHIPLISYTFLIEYVAFHRCFPPEAYWHFRACYNNSKWLWTNNFSVSLSSFAKPILGWNYSKFKPLEVKQATSGFPRRGLKLLQEWSACVHSC